MGSDDGEGELLVESGTKGMPVLVESDDDAMGKPLVLFLFLPTVPPTAPPTIAPTTTMASTTITIRPVLVRQKGTFDGFMGSAAMATGAYDSTVVGGV